MLIDSNIIIYAAMPAHEALRQFIANEAPAVSGVSVVEVLGYHLLGDQARRYFEAFFAAADVLPVSAAVIDEAVRLRQARRMTLGDSLIAATAIVFDHPLATRNVEDFAWIAELRLVDPFEAPGIA